MKILYTTTIGMTMIFFKSFIHNLIKNGHTVDIACNEKESKVANCYREWGCNIYHISWTRSPLNKDNFHAIKELNNLARKNNYDIVHCHTPIAAMCTRLACKNLRKNNMKVFYTAHGFHFYKSAPLLNWLVYYPIEWICSFWTDTLITINIEDYECAKKHFHAKRIEHVPGVGIDIDRFANVEIDRKIKRKEIGVPENAFLLISVGELNSNKNHELVIRAISELHNENIHYVIAGDGDLQDYLLCLAKKLDVENQVHLLGFRKDINELYKSADINVFPSIREGFGLAAIEGMAAGLPLICSYNRGTKSYAVNNYNSFICKSISEYCVAINYLFSNEDLYGRISANAVKTAKKFSVHLINQKLQSIYMDYFEEN